MRIELTREQLADASGETGLGLEIAVKGYRGDDSAIPTQIFVEYYNGKLAVHVWDGTSDDCVTHIIQEEKR